MSDSLITAERDAAFIINVAIIFMTSYGHILKFAAEEAVTAARKHYKVNTRTMKWCCERIKCI